MADTKNKIITRAPQPEEMNDILELRHRVLDKPFNIPPDNTLSENDYTPGVIHWAAFDDCNLVGCVRLNDLGNDTYFVRKMAVDGKYQNMGIGKLILSEAEHIAKKQGALHLLLNSRESAVDFYKKQGYSLSGKIKKFHGHKHFEMIKDL